MVDHSSSEPVGLEAGDWLDSDGPGPGKKEETVSVCFPTGICCWSKVWVAFSWRLMSWEVEVGKLECDRLLMELPCVMSITILRASPGVLSAWSGPWVPVTDSVIL